MQDWRHCAVSTYATIVVHGAVAAADGLPARLACSLALLALLLLRGCTLQVSQFAVGDVTDITAVIASAPGKAAGS